MNFFWFQNVRNATCVYWDYDTKTWSTKGVKLKITGVDKTVCQSDHLTNFALLMVRVTFIYIRIR